MMRTNKLKITISALLLLIAMVAVRCTKDEELINDTELREAFVGDWSAKDDCSKMYYAVSIDLDEDNSAQVIINNYANLGIDVPAIVGGSSIYIDKVQLEGYTLTANGKLNGATIVWSNYSYETSAQITECTAVFTKK